MTPYLTTTLTVRWFAADTIVGSALPAVVFIRPSTLPFYRFTAGVAAWFARTIAVAEDRKALSGIATQKIAEYLRAANWADDTYGVAAVAAAVPALPHVDPLPDFDAPPADPLVWGGAFDSPAVRPESAPPKSKAAPVAAPPQPTIASEWGDAKSRKPSAPAAPRKRKAKAAATSHAAGGGLFS